MIIESEVRGWKWEFCGIVFPMARAAKEHRAQYVFAYFGRLQYLRPAA